MGTSMKQSEMTLIRNRIKEMPYGSAFAISDFLDNVEYENARKCLYRLEEEGMIRRIIRGIYDKPYYSKIIDEYSSPNIDKVAYAIARHYGWVISPSESISLNLLGLSAQVSNNYEYYSSGPYKTYKVGNIDIIFKHKTSKELLNMSYKSQLVVNAIKELGKDIDDSSISIINYQLSQKEKDNLYAETKLVSKWVRDVIKRIYA